MIIREIIERSITNESAYDFLPEKHLLLKLGFECTVCHGNVNNERGENAINMMVDSDAVISAAAKHILCYTNQLFKIQNCLSNKYVICYGLMHII